MESVSAHGVCALRSLLIPFLPFLAALCPTIAVEIYTSGALEAVNGTDIRLKCTFSSFAPVGDALTVTWNFRPRDGGREQFVSGFLSPSSRPLTRMYSGSNSQLRGQTTLSQGLSKTIGKHILHYDS